MPFLSLPWVTLFSSLENKKHDERQCKNEGDRASYPQHIEHEFVGFGIVAEAKSYDLCNGGADPTLRSFDERYFEIEGEKVRTV